MKVCFIGFGSIASRHIKNLKSLYGTDIIIDLLRREKSSNLSSEFKKVIGKIYYSYNELPQDYDIIFITNPTKLHYETLKKCQKHSKHFFIEKPVFETGEESIVDLRIREDSIYYVACPLRYTNVIQYLKKNIDFSKIYSIRCISSSYLPDWRPGVDYRTTYSARKELGGGVSIDLIHEWDYLYYLLGEPEKVLNLFGKKSTLEIDSEDIAVYLAEYSDKLVELHLDYFGRFTTRKLELYGEEDTIEADLIEQKIIYKKENRIIDLREDKNAFYQKELIHFCDIISKKCSNDNDINHASKVLRITKGIR